MFLLRSSFPQLNARPHLYRCIRHSQEFHARSNIRQVVFYREENEWNKSRKRDRKIPSSLIRLMTGGSSLTRSMTGSPVAALDRRSFISGSSSKSLTSSLMSSLVAWIFAHSAGVSCTSSMEGGNKALSSSRVGGGHRFFTFWRSICWSYQHHHRWRGRGDRCRVCGGRFPGRSWWGECVFKSIGVPNIWAWFKHSESFPLPFFLPCHFTNDLIAKHPFFLQWLTAPIHAELLSLFFSFFLWVLLYLCQHW